LSTSEPAAIAVGSHGRWSEKKDLASNALAPAKGIENEYQKSASETRLVESEPKDPCW